MRIITHKLETSRKNRVWLLGLLLLAGLFLSVAQAGTPAYAAPSNGGNGGGNNSTLYHSQQGCDTQSDGNCAYCSNGGSGCVPATSGKDSAASTTCNQSGCDLIAKYINPLIEVLSASVAIVAVISVISGGIMYASATGDPQKVSAAKSRISKTVFAFVAYAFLFAFLEFLVPGGIFNH